MVKKDFIIAGLIGMSIGLIFLLFGKWIVGLLLMGLGAFVLYIVSKR